MRRYICRKVVCDHVLKVGSNPKFMLWSDDSVCSGEARKKERVDEVIVSSGTPISSPPLVFGGPVPERICVRWACGIV